MATVMTPAQRFHLEVYGYVLIPDLVLPNEFGLLRQEVMQAKTSALQGGGAGPRLGGSSIPPWVLHIRSILESSPAIVRHVMKPSLVALAEEAIGTEARLVETYAICNRRDPHEASSVDYAFHRGADPVTGGYVRAGRYHCNFIKALTFLTDVGPQDGGTVLIAGSHKIDQGMNETIHAARTNPALIHQVVARAGDTLLQFESVVHATGQIQSDTERMVLVVGYAASLYPWWDVEPLRHQFLDALPQESRTLFTGRQNWERPAPRFWERG